MTARAYTPAEDLRLVALRHSGLSFKAVAERTGRSVPAVTFRYHSLKRRGEREGHELPDLPRPGRPHRARDRSREPFSPEEDETILRLRRLDQLTAYRVIGERLGRPLSAVRKRYRALTGE